MSNTKLGIEDLQRHLYEYNKNGIWFDVFAIIELFE